MPQRIRMLLASAALVLNAVPGIAAAGSSTSGDSDSDASGSNARLPPVPRILGAPGRPEE